MIIFNSNLLYLFLLFFFINFNFYTKISICFYISYQILQLTILYIFLIDACTRYILYDIFYTIYFLF